VAEIGKKKMGGKMLMIQPYHFVIIGKCYEVSAIIGTYMFKGSKHKILNVYIYIYIERTSRSVKLKAKM
jgi:hypothetical protein